MGMGEISHMTRSGVSSGFIPMNGTGTVGGKVTWRDGCPGWSVPKFTPYTECNPETAPQRIPPSVAPYLPLVHDRSL